MRNQKGFALLLELMICCAVTAILLSAASVSLVRVRAVENTQATRARLRQISNAEATVAMCAITANNCSAAPVAPLVPPPGTLTQNGYSLRFTQVDANTWTVRADPVAPGFTGDGTLYIDSTAVLRCGTDSTAPPC